MYDLVGTLDRYMGTRVSQAWEIARMLRTSKAQGRHVLAVSFFFCSLHLPTRGGGEHYFFDFDVLSQSRYLVNNNKSTLSLVDGQGSPLVFS